MLVLYSIFLANILCTSSFHDVNFSNSFWAVLAFGLFSNKKFKYLYTFRSYAFAISIIVKQTTLACAPSVESQNSQFFHSIVIGRIVFSLRLLLRLQRPSSRYVIRESFRFRICGLKVLGTLRNHGLRAILLYLYESTKMTEAVSEIAGYLRLVLLHKT